MVSTRSLSASVFISIVAFITAIPGDAGAGGAGPPAQVALNPGGCESFGCYPTAFILRGTSQGETVDLGLDKQNGEYVFRASLGVVPTAGPDGVVTCRSASPAEARCPFAVDRHTVLLDAGDDRLRARRALTGVVGGSGDAGNDRLSIQAGGRAHVFFHGDSGSDVLVAGDFARPGEPEKRDLLTGGGGDDRLIGRGGPDEILGGAGSDAVKAGPGEDELEMAVNHREDRDTLIDCGPGNDIAYLDREDPTTRRCERIVFGRPD